MYINDLFIEAITQKSIAKKNQQLAEMEEQLEQLKKERNQLMQQYSDLDHAVTVSTDRIIRSMPSQQQQQFLQQQQQQQRSRGVVLIDAVDLLQQGNVQENARLRDQARQTEEANAQLQRELNEAKRCLDEIRTVVSSSGNGGISVGKNDNAGLVAAVKQRLVVEQQLVKENEARMKANLDNIKQNSIQTLRKYQQDADQLDQRLVQALEARQQAFVQARQRFQQPPSSRQQIPSTPSNRSSTYNSAYNYTSTSVQSTSKRY